MSIFVIFMQMEHPKKLMKKEFTFMHESWTAVHKHHPHNTAYDTFMLYSKTTTFQPLDA